MVDVVLVEDNSNDADLAMRVLKRTISGIRPHLVEDGQQAIDFFQDLLEEIKGRTDKAPSLPKLVLLDLKLPKRSGLEVLHFLRSQADFAAMPIVVLSSSREIRDVSAVYEQSANSFAVKPVQFDEYLEKISILVKYWMTINELPRVS